MILKLIQSLCRANQSSYNAEEPETKSVTRTSRFRETGLSRESSFESGITKIFRGDPPTTTKRNAEASPEESELAIPSPEVIYQDLSFQETVIPNSLKPPLDVWPHGEHWEPLRHVELKPLRHHSGSEPPPGGEGIIYHDHVHTITANGEVIPRVALNSENARYFIGRDDPGPLGPGSASKECRQIGFQPEENAWKYLLRRMKDRREEWEAFDEEFDRLEVRG